jgi:Fic-DOC domain mobile mystery protein B
MIKFLFPHDSTPMDDLSGLKFPWVQTLGDLNRVEAENISKAQKKYLESRVDSPSQWLNPTFLRKIHESMFGEVWTWAGCWRKSTTNIGIKPQLIPMRVAELCFHVISWGSQQPEWSLFERSARIHHGLVAIHPFENGNGRFSRLIADRYLAAYRHAHPIWPSQIDKEGKVRAKYIHCLKDADRGDFSSLIELMKNFTPNI